MSKKKKENYNVNEEEAIKAFMMFRSFPAEKQALAIAFMNGMDFQESMSKADDKSESVLFNKKNSIFSGYDMQNLV